MSLSAAGLTGTTHYLLSMVSLTTARTAISVGLIIFVVLVGGWVFRRTVGVILRLFELVAMTVVALIAMYVVYELVHGWRRAG